MSKVFTVEELQEFKSASNLHLVISGNVYDIHEFVDEHPGGDEVLFQEAGRDATEAFEDVGHSEEARGILKKYLVGTCPTIASAATSSRTSVAGGAASGSTNVLLLGLAGLAIAYVVYTYALNK